MLLGGIISRYSIRRGQFCPILKKLLIGSLHNLDQENISSYYHDFLLLRRMVHNLLIGSIHVENLGTFMEFNYLEYSLRIYYQQFV